MSWQRRARYIIAILGVAFAIVVARAFRTRQPAPPPTVVERSDPSALFETAGGQTLRFNRGERQMWGINLRRVDREVLAGSPAHSDPEETARDRLFDVLMRRYDALKPHRAFLRAVQEAVAAKRLKGILDLTPGIRSLQVHFDPRRVDQDELVRRIVALEEEIVRSREALKARAATKSAADAFFKR